MRQNEKIPSSYPKIDRREMTIGKPNYSRFLILEIQKPHTNGFYSETLKSCFGENILEIQKMDTDSFFHSRKLKTGSI